MFWRWIDGESVVEARFCGVVVGVRFGFGDSFEGVEMR